MFCTYCGAPLNETDKFCIKCGRPTSPDTEPTQKIKSVSRPDERWWYRLAKIFYILLYFPLPLVILIAWEENRSSYDYLTRSTVDTSEKAFWYSLLTLVIYLAIIRLIKISFLYVMLGRKPDWQKELKKFF